ncbi:hypothetical protein [Rhizobium sp. BG4]|uniref:hypothetical protein n=1 Tax=Rhizobium sp. BG4 TaxID=2613770 RepID=UPI00193E76DD|nr:hypothetical protein [Rhizobium sp. BG4]QRM45347.1 hypothetical protein F2982_19015 [Rhizobium sp. BG4]
MASSISSGGSALQAENVKTIALTAFPNGTILRLPIGDIGRVWRHPSAQTTLVRMPDGTVQVFERPEQVEAYIALADQ